MIQALQKTVQQYLFKLNIYLRITHPIIPSWTPGGNACPRPPKEMSENAHSSLICDSQAPNGHPTGIKKWWQIHSIEYSITVVLNWGQFCHPRGHLPMSGDIFSCHSQGVSTVLCPVGGGQRCWQTSQDVQDSPQPQQHRVIWPPGQWVEELPHSNRDERSALHNHAGGSHSKCGVKGAGHTSYTLLHMDEVQTQHN